MGPLEQTTIEDDLSDGQIVFFRILHQFIATPGTVLVLPLVRAHSFSMPLASLLICLCAAFSIGYGFGRLSPPRARLGYWSWVLPTIVMITDVWFATTLYNSTFTGAMKKHFFPYDDSIEWTILTIPWRQSLIYSFGLWIAAGYSRSVRKAQS